MKSFFVGLFLSFAVTAAAAPPLPTISPEDITWQVVVTDDTLGQHLGLAVLTFNEDGTIDGYAIVRKSLDANDGGFFILTGDWTEKTNGSGKFVGSMSGVSGANCGPEGGSFVVNDFTGIAKIGPAGNIIQILGVGGSKDIAFKGVEAIQLDPLPDSLASKTMKVSKKSTGGKTVVKNFETLNLAPATLGYADLYDVTGAAIGYSFFGCALLGPGGRLALTAQQDDDDTVRTVTGTMAAKTKLLGTDDADTPANVTMGLQ